VTYGSGESEEEGLHYFIVAVCVVLCVLGANQYYGKALIMALPSSDPIAFFQFPW
jgi:hypothetical protein